MHVRASFIGSLLLPPRGPRVLLTPERATLWRGGRCDRHQRCRRQRDRYVVIFTLGSHARALHCVPAHRYAVLDHLHVSWKFTEKSDQSDYTCMFRAWRNSSAPSSSRETIASNNVLQDQGICNSFWISNQYWWSKCLIKRIEWMHFVMLEMQKFLYININLNINIVLD